ncbi:hypothetical protein ACIQOU_21945 [Streptomyces sp. NPDC091279]|uniref:hypothetical protein n=1 Tax=unclassified Streptomyces TaxID=2593676 RepID=UPI00381A27E3
MRRRTLVMGLLAAGAVPAVAGCAGDDDTAQASAAASGTGGHITEATAITEVFGNGQRLTAVALKYDAVIDRSKVTNASFTVADRTVTAVYTNTSAAKAGHGTDGAYVIVELSPLDEAAAVYVDSFTHPAASSSAEKQSGPPSGKKGGGMSSSPTVKKAVASVTQTGTVTTAAGTAYAASSDVVKTSKVVNLVVDDFKTGLKYTDADTGKSLQYNLFVPKDYDKKKSYPLVLFMHDAGTVGTDPLITLTQGLGAVIWATPTEQAKRACFVLAPQFTGSDEGSDGNATALKTIKGLVDSVSGAYSIDTDRLYTTGQSGGAMSSIALDFTYPDLFAASFLVAGQWDDLDQVKPLAKQKIWAVVSQGDTKAYPGMTGLMDTVEKEGTEVSRGVWDGQLTVSEFAPLTAAMRAKDTPVNFVALKKGTVVWPGLSDDSGSNHICTWRAAYTIEGIRDWLFEQKK